MYTYDVTCTIRNINCRLYTSYCNFYVIKSRLANAGLYEMSFCSSVRSSLTCEIC